MRLTTLALISLISLALAPVAPAKPATPTQPAGLTTATTFVFVPYDKAGGPRLGDGQSVLLPYAEFLRLRATGAGQPDRPAFRPLAALAQASYHGTVEGEVVRLEAQLTIETLARPTDQLEVQLPFHGAAVESATVDGAQASLGPLGGEMGFRLFLTGEGRRTLQLKLAVPLSSDGATRRLDFSVPRAAAAALTLQIPGEVALERDPEALPATTEPAPGGGTLIKASAGSSDRLMLAFRPRVQATGGAAQARLAVEQQLRLAVSARGAEAQVGLKTTLLAGQTAALTLELPTGVRLLGVRGPFVKDWTAPDERRRVTVALVRELAQSFELTLDAQLEAAATTATAERLSIPEFRVPGAVQESGTILIVPDRALAIWPEQTDGLEAVAAAADEGAAARKFRFAQPGWRLTLTRRPMPARIRASGLALYEVTDELIRLKTRQRLTIGGRAIFGVALRVPEGYELREAGPDALVAGFRQQGQRVEINFRGEQAREAELELVLQRPGIPPGAPLRLEPVSVEEADENTGNLVLAMPLALRATERDSGGVEATDTRALEVALRGLLTADLEPVLGYHYFTPTAHAEALIERQRTRLACETALLATITPSLMRVDASLNFNVEFSATDAFQVLLPASAGEDVRFTGADIKEKARAAAKVAGDGLTTWTVRLQRRVLGPYPLGISFDVPLPPTDKAQAVTVSVPRIRAAGVARETGWIAVSRGENLEVKVESAEGLETRDVKELPPQMANAFLGFRYFDPDHQALRLGLIRHDLESVLGALVRRLHIETVLSDQLEAVHEAIFEVQNNSRQYMELKLPKGMEIWSAFVRGVPVRSTTRQSDGARLIELTKSATQDSAFRVRLVLHQKLDGAAMGRLGTLRFDPPEPQGIPVLRTTWKLYLPRGYRYVSFGGSMRQETGGGVPWIEPAAERLLGDLPARLAGGIARPALNPPDAALAVNYSGGETGEEMQARLQASALEIPIVREGLQFEFSKLSGIGSIEAHYWQRKTLVILQGILGLFLFLALLGLMLRRGRVGDALAIVVGFFILASLTSGLAGRLFATALAATAAAFVLGLAIYTLRRRARVAAENASSLSDN